MCKMIKLTCLPVIFSVFVTTCTGQWPLGPEFYNSMNRMVNNLNNMAVNMQAMGVRLQRELEANMTRLQREQEANMAHLQRELEADMARLQWEQEAKTAKDMRRAKEGIPFGNGGVVFVTAEGGLGYAYNSTDGSYTLYYLGSGSPPSGYMYHVGPFRTTYRNW